MGTTPPSAAARHHARGVLSVAAAILVVGLLGGLIASYVIFLRSGGPSPVYAQVRSAPVLPQGGGAPGSTRPGDAALELMTVGSIGHEPHPDWVSYFARTPGGPWMHSTVLVVPAYSNIHVTVYQFDTSTGLRNPFWSESRGLQGGLHIDGGAPVVGIPAADVSHTWAVVGLGVDVPLKGIASNAPRQCAAGPCPMSDAHTTTSFTFYSGPPGTYQWQCFVPCALQFIFGNGGPMQTEGYMDGFLRVES
jgi:hypothetical protein